MKARPYLLLAASAVLGIIAVILVKHLIRPPEAPGTEKVAVASAQMRFGDRVLPANVHLVDYPPGSVPEGAFHDIDELASGDPRFVLQTIEPGEPVLSAKITGKGGKASLSSVIEQQKRAVTIRVDDVFGVGGFITPADHVDVMLTHGRDPEKPNENPRTEILLQNIRVLGVDQEANELKDKPSVAKAVTLEVTPEEAQKLALARNVGTLSLSLRNFANPKSIDSRTVSMTDLLPAQAREPSPEKARSVRHYRIEVIRGTEPTRYELYHDGSVVKSDARNGNG